MLDSAVSLLNPIYNDYLATGREPELIGNLSLTRMPTANVFPTAEGWIQITVITRPHIEALFEVLGLTHLWHDSRFASEQAQREHQAELHQLIVEALACEDSATWLARLREADLPVAPIASLPEVLADEQNEFRALSHTLDAPSQLGVENVTSITTGYTANVDGPKARLFAPLLGADTSEILNEIGFSDDEAKALHRDGAVA